MNQPPEWKKGLQYLQYLTAGVEGEAARLIAYVDDLIVPVVRREAQGALHGAAVELREAAGRWEARLAAEQVRSRNGL